MPYKISKSGDKYCVIKKDDGKKMGCHASRDEAISQVQAIHANEAMQAIAESFNTEEELEVEINLNAEEEVELDSEYEEYTIAEDEALWAGNIVFEGEPTGDNREFIAGAVTWDELPIPLSWQKVSSDGHSGSVVIGRVDEMEKRENAVFARGVLLNTPEANEYKDLMQAGAGGGVSIDGDTAAYSVEELEGGKHKVSFSSIRVRGLTAVAIPAFARAKISLIDLTEGAEAEFCDGGCPDSGCHHIEEYKSKKRKARKGYLTAASGPIRPPLNWFQDQVLPGPTPLTVLEDGQIFGHLALWGTCHIGMPKCTTPPKGSNYGYFHTGALSTEEGVEVSVGHLTFNTGHADIHSNAYNAASHYDHTGAVAADVTAGEDSFGIWVAGALRPHLTEEEVRTFKSAPLSGDWRRIGSRMELVGALSVNTPGFPVPRERTKVLVASGQDQTFISTLLDTDYEAIGRQVYKDDLASKIEEFYNTCHDSEGHFCEGPDGPGRVRDNMKKVEKTLPKNAPQWMKNMLSRKQGQKAAKDVAKIEKAKGGLSEKAPKYMSEILDRKAKQRKAKS